MSASETGFEEGVLCYLRGLGDPCLPPIGAGSFLLLYANIVEVVVWFDPAREHGRSPGEVAIPSSLLCSAWTSLVSGETLDLLALARIAGGPAGAHWLLALLSLVPDVRFTQDPPEICWIAGRETSPGS